MVAISVNRKMEPPLPNLDLLNSEKSISHVKCSKYFKFIDILANESYLTKIYQIFTIKNKIIKADPLINFETRGVKSSK